VKKELRPVHELEACDVCGRTILKGERTEVYLAPGGERHRVCDLCFARAESSGWLRESAHGDAPARMPRAEPRRPLLGRFKRRASRPEPAHPLEPAPEAAPEPPFADEYAASDGAPAHPGALELDGRPPATGDGGLAPEVEPEPEPPPRARERPKDPRHVRAVPTTAEVKVERALEFFNRSEHQRTVAGLARSLGDPWVTALADLEAPSMVTVVVAWELSWYRYRIDLGDEHDPVALQDKGEEIGQIEDQLREWNAGLDEHGRLVIGVAQQ